MWRSALHALHRSGTSLRQASAPIAWPLQQESAGLGLLAPAYAGNANATAVLHQKWTRGIRSRAKPKPKYDPRQLHRKHNKRPAQFHKSALIGVPRGKSGWGLEDDLPDDDVLLDAHGDPIIQRIPVPDGVPTDHMAFYDIANSARALGPVPGIDSLFAVHGPSEVWAPHPDGLIRGHGASGGVFAVFQAPGVCYKVMEGDVFYTNKFVGDVNSKVVFDDVLILGAVDWSWLGRPCIKDASVVTTIEEQAKSAKIYITKFKRKTGYKRRKGHRQNITRFRVNEIRFSLPEKSRFSDHIPEYDPKGKERNFTFEL